MKIVIIGDGKVGHKLAKQLSEENHNVVLIDNDEVKLKETINKLDISCVGGDGVSAEIQGEAGVADSDLLIACASTDELNMLSCLIAKRLGAKHTIARVRNPIYFQQIHILKEDFFLPEENIDIRSLPLGLLRRWRQNGYFTVQPQSTIYTPLNEIKLPDEMRLIKITISSSEKNILLKNKKIISENELIVDNNHPILKEIEELNRKFI